MAYKKKEEPPKGGAPEYMSTYGDMVTLLLCFFVLLFAMSNISEDKFTAMAESFGGRQTLIKGGMGNILPGNTGINIMPNYTSGEGAEGEDTGQQSSQEAYERQQAELNGMAETFKTYLAENIATQKIAVDVLGDYLRITFPDGVLFDSGRAVLKPEALEVIDFVAVELMKYPGNNIKVEGHTDNVPMNAHNSLYPDNFYLSAARAITVVEYLINEKGFDPKQLSAEGKSEYWPVDTNDTPEGRARNRRVVINVYSPQASDPMISLD